MTTYKQKFDNLVRDAVKAASERFLEYGEHPLTNWLLEDSLGTRMLIAFAPDVPKQEMLKQMRKAAQDKDIVRYTVDLEVWTALPVPDDQRRPKERPDRMEALIVYGRDRQNNTASILIEIERKGDKYYLGEPVHMDLAGEELELFR